MTPHPTPGDPARPFREVLAALRVGFPASLTTSQRTLSDSNGSPRKFASARRSS